MTARFDIAIPTRNRTRVLMRCIDSVLKNNRNRIASIILVVNPDDKFTNAYIQEITAVHRFVKGVPLAYACRNRAKNEALAHAQADWVYFLDDDVVLPPDNLDVLAAKIEANPGLAALGGPNLTPEDDGTDFEKAIGQVLASRFATYNTQKRFIKGTEDFPATENSLQSSNLCVNRRELGRWTAPFEPDLYSGEETLLLARLRNAGLPMLASPALAVLHYRRADFKSFCRQIFLCGAGRGQMTKRLPESFKASFAVPTIFILYLFSLALPSLRSIPGWTGPLGLYFLILLINIALVWARSTAKQALMASFMFSTIHICYGTGFVWGLFRNKPDTVADGTP